MDLFHPEAILAFTGALEPIYEPVARRGSARAAALALASGRAEWIGQRRMAGGAEL